MMNLNHLNHDVLVPPCLPWLPNEVDSLQFLSALRRNAYTAFPRRCLDEPVVKLRAAWRKLILTCSPDAIRHIMMTNADDYVRLPFGRRVLGPIVGRGLLTSEGELWRRQRRVLEQSCGTEMDLLLELQMPSLEIAAASMFSESSTFGSELRAMISKYADGMGRVSPFDVLLPDGIPTPMRIRRALFRRRWRRLIHSIIEARRAAKHTGAGRDLFDLLSKAHGPNGEDLLADEVSTMIVAGQQQP